MRCTDSAAATPPTKVRNSAPVPAYTGCTPIRAASTMAATAAIRPSNSTENRMAANATGISSGRTGPWRAATPAATTTTPNTMAKKARARNERYSSGRKNRQMTPNSAHSSASRPTTPVVASAPRTRPPAPLCITARNAASFAATAGVTTSCAPMIFSPGCTTACTESTVRRSASRRRSVSARSYTSVGR